MKKIFGLAKRFPVVTAVLIIAVLAFGADRADFYHINLKGDIVGKNMALKSKIISLSNSRATEVFYVDSVGNVVAPTVTSSGISVFTVYPTFSTVASGIDSFTTTAATDSVTLSGSVGFTQMSPTFVRQMNPAYSTVVDTAIYSGQVVTTGAGLTKLVVTRVKSYTGNGVTAVKSGAQYFYEVRKP